MKGSNMMTSGYAQLGSDVRAMGAGIAAQSQQAPISELDQIEGRLQNIAAGALVQGNAAGDFVTRVAPHLIEPENKTATSPLAGNGAIARIHTLLNALDEHLNALSRLNSYLGRIG